MAESISTETETTAEIETISVEGSDSQIYYDMLRYTPTNDAEKRFLENLKEAVETGFKPFKVPICDPSIDENGRIQFVAGKEPAVGYSYNELQELARKNGLCLGEKKHYIPFLATIAHRLTEEGWSKTDAVYAVCSDSTKLGHYFRSVNAKKDFEPTGSRMIAGKCDLANTLKILAKDEETGGFWLAGGGYLSNGDDGPLADLRLGINYDGQCNNSVGWFVL